MADEMLSGAQGPGELLRAAREQRGMSLQDVADGLNLKRRTVEALEDELFDQLPPHPFVKGYYRAYANLVGVKEYDILAALDRRLPEAAPEPLVVNRPGEAGGGWLKWLLAAVAVGLVLFYLYSREEPAPPPAPQAMTSEADAPAAAEDASRIAPPLIEAEPMEPAPLAPEEPEEEPFEDEDLAAFSEPEEPAAEPEEPAAGSEPASPPVLSVDVRGESWLEVRDGEGRALYTGIARGPRSFEFTAPPPYSLVVGDYSEVEVRYGGESIPLAAHARGRVARLSVP